MTPARVGLILGLAAALAATAASVALIRGGRGRALADRASAEVGGVALVYPPAYARFPAGRGGGRLDRVDMAFEFPSLQGAGAAAQTLPADDAPHADQTLVFMTLRAEDETEDPATRTETLYARFLEPDVWRDENGLVMRRFAVNSPYEREELRFTPPDGRQFAARCLRPTQPPSDLPSTCLTTLRRRGLDVDLRFPPALIGRWDALIEGAGRLVDAFAAR